MFQRAAGIVLVCLVAAQAVVGRSFTIENDRLVRDGQPIQIISGSIQHFRIHPDHWLDRLERCRAMGLNTVEVYVPWNMHEPYPGQYIWTGFADIERFVRLAEGLGLLVMLRSGPYICAEWDFGGFPWWLASSKASGARIGGLVAGGRTMQLRSNDPTFLAHVDRWWAVLFSKVRPLLYHNGGPIIMVENEYGYCGSDKAYLAHLVASARHHLGPEALLYTTDPPSQIQRGTLAGDAVFRREGAGATAEAEAAARRCHGGDAMGAMPRGRGEACGRPRPPLRSARRLPEARHACWSHGCPCILTPLHPASLSVVDFGPRWLPLDNAFGAQRSMNAAGKSPPFCSEFYTGWLSHWGEPMANFSTDVLLSAGKELLEYANSSASLSFYMVHGGTNFGFTAGANVDGQTYQPTITSYDYDAPISEAGDYCQPGIGGACKYFALRELIANHTGVAPPPVPPRPAIRAYGPVALNSSAALFDALPALWSGEGILDEAPQPMEEYGQRWGLMLYRAWVPAAALAGPVVTLDVGRPIHDYASIYVEGRLVLRTGRGAYGLAGGNSPAGATRLRLPTRPLRAGSSGGEELVHLDILVEAMGRQNFGCDVGGWDLKGLQSSTVRLNDEVVRGWRVFPLQLDDVNTFSYATGHAGSRMPAGARHLLARPSAASSVLAAPVDGGSALREQLGGPVFYRGALAVEPGSPRGRTGHLADTYLAIHGWGKGVAWVNGFNLGWYWPSRGPQMTLYVPGAALREGENEIVLLEVECARPDVTVTLSDQADFSGPGGPAQGAEAAAVVSPVLRRRVSSGARLL
eukprot:scaffold5.g1001.t1